MRRVAREVSGLRTVAQMLAASPVLGNACIAIETPSQRRKRSSPEALLNAACVLYIGRSLCFLMPLALTLASPPVLFLNGQRDRVFRRHEKAFVAAARRGRLQIIPRGSHRCNLEYPEAFTGAVRGSRGGSNGSRAADRWPVRGGVFWSRDRVCFRLSGELR